MKEKGSTNITALDLLKTNGIIVVRFLNIQNPFVIENVRIFTCE